MHELMRLKELSGPYSETYEEMQDEIDVSEDLGIAFRKTVDIKGHDIYVHIHELEEETKHIMKYAVGIEKEGKNFVRYDNAKDHHDGLIYDPHHKHIGHDETVADFDGKIDTLIKELEEIHLPKIM